MEWDTERSGMDYLYSLKDWAMAWDVRHWRKPPSWSDDPIRVGECFLFGPRWWGMGQLLGAMAGCALIFDPRRPPGRFVAVGRHSSLALLSLFMEQARPHIRKSERRQMETVALGLLSHPLPRYLQAYRQQRHAPLYLRHKVSILYPRLRLRDADREIALRFAAPDGCRVGGAVWGLPFYREGRHLESPLPTRPRAR